MIQSGEKLRDLTDREETAADIVGDSVRTVQRNRDNLLRLVAEQLLYMELDFLDALIEENDGLKLNIGWDGFQTDSWSVQWKLEKDSNGAWVHRIEKRLALTSGGIGTMALPLGAFWSGSELETTTVEPSDIQVERFKGIPHRWSPDPYPYDLFFFGRNIPRGDTVFLTYHQTGYDPDRTFEPFAAYRPRNVGVDLSWHVELPASLPPEAVRLTVTAGLPPHTHELESVPIEASSDGLYRAQKIVDVDPKKQEDLRYQLEFDKAAFDDLY